MTTLDNDDDADDVDHEQWSRPNSLPEETTPVEQTNNSWLIDSCFRGFDNDLKRNRNHDNDTDDDDDGIDWKDDLSVAWSPSLTCTSIYQTISIVVVLQKGSMQLPLSEQL